MKLLIVEDSRFIQNILKRILSKYPYELSFANNGLEGLQMFKDGSPDVILTDIEMPERNGLEMIEDIRSLDQDHETYIITITANEDKDLLDHVFDLGADDFVVKPIDERQLVYRLKVAEKYLHSKINQSLIYALMSLTDTKDEQTGKHIERVSQYSRLLSEALHKEKLYVEEITTLFINKISIYSALHDIGKVGIPDAILKKEGKLNAEEMKIMESHTVLGYETIQRILEKYPSLHGFEFAADICRSHHERYDGKGYPDGLKGEMIPVAAQIVALADVYDALRSERPYKEIFSHEKSVELIKQEKGQHFNPKIVDAFLNIESKFKQVSLDLID